MKTRIQKWGNSLALRIPRACAAEAEITQETLVEVWVENGALMVRPLLPSRTTLADLLEGVTDDNLHRETDFGPAIGSETW